MPEEEKLRADARANRDRILDVAREALAADRDASMNSIAKLAGVGPGTLYRHFPNREALALGVYRKEIDALVALSARLRLEEPPLSALRLWCDRLIQLGRVKQGIVDPLHSAMSTKDFDETLAAMVEAIGRLMRACEAAGEIRPDVNPADVLVMLSSLLRLPPSREGQAQSRRVLDLIFRAIQTKAA